MSSTKNEPKNKEIDSLTLLDNIKEVGIFNKLELFDPKKKNMPIEVEPTDLAVLTGAVRDEEGYTPYWTQTSGMHYIAVITSHKYSKDGHYEAKRYSLSPAIRPVFSMDSVSNPDNLKQNPNNPMEYTYGEYPQSIETDEDKIIELERLERLNKTYFLTNKKYCFDGKHYLKEYVLDGVKYVKVNSKNTGPGNILSDNKEVDTNKTYWVKVEPITWIYDEASRKLISKYGLLSGVPYWTVENEAKFTESNMYKYMVEYMAQDLFTISDIRKVNDYNTYLSNNIFGIDESRKTASETVNDLIKSRVSVFLHGDTGVGKSARVEQIDPEASIIYLCNQTIDSLNGKSIYVPPVIKKINGVETIVEEGHVEKMKPSWLVELEDKCAKEPDKLHIVFFDEISNAPLAIQSFCFNIILNGEVAGCWHLPENARIVAAGNEVDESLSANEIAEPLFARFGHIYISDDVKEWLRWATDADIHPSIIAFMVSTNGKNLRTKYDGLNPNADPRKWEMASKCLKATKNVRLLDGLIGEDLRKAFVSFCRSKTVTINDVMNKRYNDSIFNMNSSEKFATALTLSGCTNDQFAVIHDFMARVGDEACALFESLWAKGNEERLEILSELRESQRNVREAKRAQILQKKQESDAEYAQRMIDDMTKAANAIKAGQAVKAKVLKKGGNA